MYEYIRGKLNRFVTAELSHKSVLVSSVCYKVPTKYLTLCQYDNADVSLTGGVSPDSGNQTLFGQTIEVGF